MKYASHKKTTPLLYLHKASKVVKSNSKKQSNAVTRRWGLGAEGEMESHYTMDTDSVSQVEKVLEICVHT